MARWRSSAAYRIAFTYSAAFALAILLLGVAVYFAADAEFRHQRDLAIAEEVAELVQEGDVANLSREIAERETAKATDAFGYALFDRAGKRIAGSLDTTRPEPGFGTIIFIDPQEGPDPARAKTVELRGGERLVVAVDSESIEQIDATILELFAAAFLMVLIIGVGGALMLGHYLRRRLETIGGTARAIVAGDLAQRVPIGADQDEFDQVGAALNAMLDRIAHLMENLHQVSSDVAHDLRTPLVRLRNQLDLVGSVEGAAARAIEQGDQLLALFASILRIAEVEAGTLAQSFESLDLSSLVAGVCEDYEPAITDSGRTLVCEVGPGIEISGNRELLAQAIGNLLDNARLHTPIGSRIAVSLRADKSATRLSVCDNGPGVPVADRGRILQRFVRGEASRTTPGNGLGLSLVAAVAGAHGGGVTVEDNDPGLCVTIQLFRNAR
ncbi:MAG: HAMP domain-containing sensor histidine kinase [Sphingomonas sp.]